MTFLQEREQYINELADLDSPSEESADAQIRWNKWRALHREYADEVARSGMGGRQMKRRILALLDEHWEQERTPPTDRFEVVGLLRVFAVEEIADRGDMSKGRQAFINKWDVHHRGITVKVIALSHGCLLVMTCWAQVRAAPSPSC